MPQKYSLFINNPFWKEEEINIEIVDSVAPFSKKKHTEINTLFCFTSRGTQLPLSNNPSRIIILVYQGYSNRKI